MVMKKLKQAAVPLLQDLKERKISPLGIIRYLLLYRYFFPEIFFHWPQVIRRLGRVMIGRYAFPVFAFTPRDAHLRTYYSKLVRNFRDVGRLGYVWDEGLGFPMGPRFGSNMITYLIYGALSPRAFSLVSLLSFILAVVISGIVVGQPMLMILIVLMLVASPPIIFSLAAHRVKPEVLWWSLAIPIFLASLYHNWLLVWVLFSVLLLVNSTVSVIIGFMLSGPWLWSVMHGQFHIDWSLLVLMAGLAIRLGRFWYAYRAGNFGATIKEQQTAKKRSAEPGSNNHRPLLKRAVELSKTEIKFFLYLMIASWGYLPQGLALGLPLVVLYAVNELWTKIADSVSFHIVIMCTLIAAVLYSGEWIGLVSLFMFLYEKPFATIWELGGRKKREKLYTQYLQTIKDYPTRGKIEFFSRVSRDYPWISPMPMASSLAIMEMFENIPDSSRILMESKGDPRQGGQLTRFHDWTYEFLPARQIEFLNHTFINRMLDPLLAERYLNHFEVPHLKPETMHRVCCDLGISHVITFTHETATALKRLGYREIMTVPYDTYADLADILNMPETTLTLLANSELTGIISPNVAWVRNKNAISWEAEKNKTYNLRYRFHPHFVAGQGDQQLKIEPQVVFCDQPLRFMNIRAVQDGTLTVTFVPRYII